MKNIRGKKKEMVIKCIFTFILFLSLDSTICQLNDCSDFKNLVREKSTNNEVARKIASDSIRAYNPSGRFPPEMIEYTILGFKPNDIEDKKERINEQKIRLKKFDSLMKCSDTYIRELVKNKKASLNLIGPLDEIERVYSNFKIILASLKMHYLKDKSFLKNVDISGIMNRLTLDRQIIYFLLRSFIDEIKASSKQKTMTTVSDYKNFTKFFKTYDELKKSLSVSQLKDIEIVNFLKLITIIPNEIKDKNTQRKRALTKAEEINAADFFIQQLHQFIAKKKRSWYLSKLEKTMITDAQDIINALNNHYYLVSEFDFAKIASLDIIEKQILIAQLNFLDVIISMLILNIENLKNH